MGWCVFKGTKVLDIYLLLWNRFYINPHRGGPGPGCARSPGWGRRSTSSGLRWMQIHRMCTHSMPGWSWLRQASPRPGEVCILPPAQKVTPSRPAQPRRGCPPASEEAVHRARQGEVARPRHQGSTVRRPWGSQPRPGSGPPRPREAPEGWWRKRGRRRSPSLCRVVSAGWPAPHPPRACPLRELRGRAGATAAPSPGGS